MIEQHTKQSICPNCQTDLPNFENFCPNCGQKNQAILLPVRALLTDLIDSFFNYDSRLWSSLRFLFFKPGQLTIDFLNGKRVRFMPPLKIYLFSSVLCFLLVAINFQRDATVISKNLETSTIANPTGELHVNFGLNSIKISRLELEQLKSNTLDLDSFMQRKNIPPTTINKLTIQQATRALTGEMGSVMKKFTEYTSLSMFVLMPAFAWILFLFFRKKRSFYIEHLVFSLHLHSLVFILFFIKELILLVFQVQLKNQTWLNSVLFFLLPIFLVLHLKKVYELRWLDAIFKGFLIIILYTVALLIAGAGVGTLSLLMF